MISKIEEGEENVKNLIRKAFDEGVLDISQSSKLEKLIGGKIESSPITEETILYQVEAKFGAARVMLKPQRKGRGLVAGGTVRVICTLAGIKNVSSKIIGRTGNNLR